MVTVDDVRRLALALPRTEEHLVRDRVKFRIGRIVYLALSRDETELGFAFPKEERAALIAAEPEKFFLPGAGDMRYHWVEARMAALGVAELEELVTGAWRMCVPAKVARAHLEGGAEGGLPPAPGLARLRAAAEVFGAFPGVDRSWLALCADTAPGLDLSGAAHRAALHRWLNTWGCRIRYPREGEPDLLGEGLERWWSRHGGLPGARLAALSDREIGLLAAAFGELAALPVGRRTLGPTAAAKALFALRPETVMPWDAAIAQRLWGARDEAAFARHLTAGRAWARAALAESGGLDEAALAAELGRPGLPLAKLLDEYLYVTITHQGA
ncbi:MmcQ/YjbR family DNA-binding protein [Streptomyces katrae]|uniref:MmcQ/YjbR family DNA-binding protein n=1 Tax=Streptomyces katrae TaxID=68223 RepID=UPI0009A4A057|nr:MmcQ/YjbR family DNA-binding protein [Streptomyces katrae]